MAFRMRFNGKEAPSSRVPALGTATPVGVLVVTETCVAGAFERSKVITSSRQSIGGVDAGLFDISTCESVDRGVAWCEGTDFAVRACELPSAVGHDKNAEDGWILAGCPVKETEGPPVRP